VKTAATSRSATRKAVVAGIALATVAVVSIAVLAFTNSSASPVSVRGNATHFAGFGSAYSGCGLPEQVLDSQDFVSLNVFDTPGDYGAHNRPIPPSESNHIGRWENGRNCGRFVQVTIGNFCTGVNDGARGQAFCREGSWVADDFTGATLTMVVADGCADATAWCRDDPDHLGLSSSSLKRFKKGGVLAGDIDAKHWNNRHVSWSYVPTPNYSGDLKIGFLRDAQSAWPAIAVSHLPNGMHGVEYLSADGRWRQAKPNGDMGQSFLLGSDVPLGDAYRIRVRDVSDELVNAGREYSFTLPPQCAPKCTEAYTKADYTTETAAWTSAATPPSTSSSTPTTTTTTETTTTTTTTTTTPPTTTKTVPAPPAKACSITPSVYGSWPGAYQVEFTVRNTGTAPLSGWSTGFSFSGSQRVTTSWNALVTQSGNHLVGNNQSYNGSLPPGASTSWGAIMSGTDQPLTGLRCTPK